MESIASQQADWIQQADRVAIHGSGYRSTYFNCFIILRRCRTFHYGQEEFNHALLRTEKGSHITYVTFPHFCCLLACVLDFLLGPAQSVLFGPPALLPVWSPSSFIRCWRFFLPFHLSRVYAQVSLLPLCYTHLLMSVMCVYTFWPSPVVPLTAAAWLLVID